MIEVKVLKHKKEKAILIGRHHQKLKLNTLNEYLDELEFLASTLNIETVCKFTQSIEKPDKKTFLGSGKLEEVKEYIQGFEIETAIFDDELTASQVRNIEKELGVKIYDRNLLILDIFLLRAQTSQAKTQVELARAQYLLPRLTRMWTHLERQRGGTATRGGAGEKEIETDKRVIRDKITRLRKKLDKIEQQNATQRKNRKGIVSLALVGYTNVGKSTLMNNLTKANILAEDKLFATVDSTVRKINLDGIPCVISDTVGFIRKLPTFLVESFKSTLDETKYSDILLHVVDISDPCFDAKIETVNDILAQLKSTEKPTIIIFNKTDKFEEGKSEIEIADFYAYLNQTFSSHNVSTICLSGIDKKNLGPLRAVIRSEALKIFKTIYPNYLDYGFQIEE